MNLKGRSHFLIFAISLIFVLFTVSCYAKIPLIYMTDLYHPHNDPDDHFDIATIYALDDFDVKAIILDDGDWQQKASGTIPVNQMNTIFGRNVPAAIGLAEPLKSVTDTGLDQPEEFHAGVNLMLTILRNSPEPVTIIQVGSLRDLAAAFNREPDLLRQKVGRIYVNSGNAAGLQDEYNANLDPLAFRCVMESGLPIWYCPCFGDGGWHVNWLEPKEGLGTCWTFQMGPLFNELTPQMRAFFMYCFTKMPGEFHPVKAVQEPDWMDYLNDNWRRDLWATRRPMWSTASFVHAAEREIYRLADNSIAVFNEIKAQQTAVSEAQRINAFTFRPAKFTFVDDTHAVLDLNVETSNIRILCAEDRNIYRDAMIGSVQYLLSE